jgi:hypothetical protein
MACLTGRGDTPTQNCLFTPELQWQSRGKRRILQGNGRGSMGPDYKVPAPPPPPPEEGRPYSEVTFLSLKLTFLSRPRHVLTPLQYWLFTPELQWQSRGKRAHLTGCQRETLGVAPKHRGRGERPTGGGLPCEGQVTHALMHSCTHALVHGI